MYVHLYYQVQHGNIAGARIVLQQLIGSNTLQQVCVCVSVCV